MGRGVGRGVRRRVAEEWEENGRRMGGEWEEGGEVGRWGGGVG